MCKIVIQKKKKKIKWVRCHLWIVGGGGGACADICFFFCLPAEVRHVCGRYSYPQGIIFLVSHSNLRCIFDMTAIQNIFCVAVLFHRSVQNFIWNVYPSAEIANQIWGGKLFPDPIISLTHFFRKGKSVPWAWAPPPPPSNLFQGGGGGVWHCCILPPLSKQPGATP